MDILPAEFKIGDAIVYQFPDKPDANSSWIQGITEDRRFIQIDHQWYAVDVFVGISKE